MKSQTLSKSYLPEWNSPEVIQAMLATLQAAYDYQKVINDDHDQPMNIYNCRFVFGTESCVPIYPLEDSIERLFAKESSWLNVYTVPKNNWESSNCFKSVDPAIISPKVS